MKNLNNMLHHTRRTFITGVSVFIRKSNSAIHKIRVRVLFFIFKIIPTPSLSSARKHPLDRKLIVSLTSYELRFNLLRLTLKSLLMQTIKPDQLILWLSEDDYKKFPKDLYILRKKGLTIKSCSDLKSYKKIIPTLELFPDAYIVTADDDIYYRRTWLEDLVTNSHLANGDIICHRAHRIKLDPNGLPLRYEHWEWNTQTPGPSKLLFPTSGGGVIYPPNTFQSTVTDSDTFLKLCPNADDIWLYWMASLNGKNFRLVQKPKRIIPWPDSNGISLADYNNGIEDGNNRQIKNLISVFDFPPRNFSRCRPGIHAGHTQEQLLPHRATLDCPGALD